MSGARKKPGESTNVSPQEVAAELGVLRGRRLAWSWEDLEDAAVVLYWERRPNPTVTLGVAS